MSRLITKFSFNSNLVQLKELRCLRSAKNLFCFNSNLVQLKELRCLRSAKNLFCFNSNLVQLKEVVKLILDCKTLF
ncbi:Uncharacterised protein [Porphyromonas macacae]|uniref:Uncharacterized protein n=1 Tax=Porphyromonas macacae TaxID=28115 RepID=A0A379E9Z2_9PORP|nr:Uncharacterised protein [Porphyromonas macacae]